MALGINSNVAGLQANRSLYGANLQTNKALQKLSSGLRINQGSDDPAGLIISELLRSQVSGYERALRNTQETSNVMSIAEGGLSSVSSMLTRMRGLAIHALNSGVTADAQVDADQMEVNSLLSSINRVVSTTNYAGQNLIDGSRDFTYGTDDPSGILDPNRTSIASVAGTSTGDVSVSFAGGAGVQAERAFLEADFGGGTLATEQEITITGAEGARTMTFAAGTSVADMAATIDAAADSTGVNAYAIRDAGSGATAIRLASAAYGSDAAIRVDQRTGDGFARQGATATDYGQDATIAVNGVAVVTNGLAANVQTNDFNGRIAFTETGAAGTTGIAQTGYDQDDLVDAAAARQANISNVSGGMQLQLGEASGGQARERVSLGNYNPAVLGQVNYEGRNYSLNDLYAGGAASLAANPQLAMSIIEQAISDVASGRGNIGAYQANALETNANNLMVAIENITATESGIRDTDMALTVMDLVRAQLLRDTSSFGVQSANMMARNVSSLLGIG